MNSKKEMIVKSMKQQTIGVEIEMADITRKDAINVIANYFGTADTICYIGERYYYSWTCKDTQGRTWKVSRDSSINPTVDNLPSERDKRAEMITPILKYSDIEDLQEIIRGLRKAGAVSNPDHGCGVHVHIGANGHTPTTLRNLLNIMATRQELIAEAINMDSSRKTTYCKPTRKALIKSINENKPNTMNQLADAWYEEDPYGRNQHYNHSRYHMINLHAFFTHGTVEFRLFQFDNPTEDRKGGLHAGQLKAYIQLALAINEYSKHIKCSHTQEVTAENKKRKMYRWLTHVLGLTGKEFETLHKVMIDRLPGTKYIKAA